MGTTSNHTIAIGRRELLNAAAIACVGLMSGCDKSGSSGSPTTSPSASGSPYATKAAVKSYMIVAVMIGERLVKFPHPVIRVIGVVLIVGGELVISYLTVDEATGEASKGSKSVALTPDEASKLTDARVVTFVRQDGDIETRPIDKLKSPGEQ